MGAGNWQRVHALAEDQGGALWVGTIDGLYRLAAGKSAFEAVDIGIAKVFDGRRPVDLLLQDQQGALWIASGETLYRRMPDGATRVYRDSRIKDGIRTLYEDREGRLWAANGDGLYQLNPDAAPNDPVVSRVYTAKDGLAHNWVGTMLQTADGRFWAGTAGGLSLYIPGADRFESYTTSQGLSDPGVQSLAEDREGNLWVGTDNGGVMRIARHGFTSYTQADGLGNTHINSLFLDLAGDLCAVTSPLPIKWSIDCFNGKRFTSIRPQYPHSIRYFGWGSMQTAFQDHTGEWWIPTGEGICRFSRTSRTADLAGRRPSQRYLKF